MDEPGPSRPGAGARPPYRVLSHTADTGIEASGRSREELIANAARGMFALMYGPDPGDADEAVTFTIDSCDAEDLLVDTLSELLFRSETADLAFFRFTVEASGNCRLQVTATGRSVDGLDLTGPPIKAVTYHALEVIHDDGWRARIIFDV
jgi:SHS2 domain-containing protein